MSATPASLAKRCQDAFNEMEAGKKKEPGEKQISLSDQHILHRCVTPLEIDKNLDKPQATAFQRHDLSFYAEGPGLPSLNIASIIAGSEGKFVAAAIVEAGTILNSQLDEVKKLTLVHDPYIDPIGNKHLNHVRLICTKGMGVCKELQKQVMGWSVKP